MTSVDVTFFESKSYFEAKSSMLESDDEYMFFSSESLLIN